MPIVHPLSIMPVVTYAGYSEIIIGYALVFTIGLCLFGGQICQVDTSYLRDPGFKSLADIFNTGFLLGGVGDNA